MQSELEVAGVWFCMLESGDMDGQPGCLLFGLDSPVQRDGCNVWACMAQISTNGKQKYNLQQEYSRGMIGYNPSKQTFLFARKV